MKTEDEDGGKLNVTLRDETDHDIALRTAPSLQGTA